MMKVSYEDTSIFRQNCDIFAPCARFKVRHFFYGCIDLRMTLIFSEAVFVASISRLTHRDQLPIVCLSLCLSIRLDVDVVAC